MSPPQYLRRAEEASSGPSSSKRRRLQSPLEASVSRSLPRRIPSHTSSRESDSEDDERTRESGSESSSDKDAEGEDDLDDSSGDWSYELVVVQHPQRARACGFGDKDRRPLSPPPILRLIIRTSLGRLVHPSKVNIQTLLVMVDLWSTDLLQQRNVVMHAATTSARPASPKHLSTTSPSTYPQIPSQPSSSSRRPTISDDRPPSSHYPVMDWGWPAAQDAEAPDSTNSDPSPHTVTAQATLNDHLPVPSTPPQPSSSVSHSRPASSPLPIHLNPANPTQISSHRPQTSPSSFHPLSQTNPDRRTSITLPSLSSITENLPSHFPTPSSFDIIRDPTALSSPYTSFGRPSTSSRGSTRPSWSTESSRPHTGYSLGRGSTSTWNTSFSSDSAGREKPHVTGWPPPSSFSESDRPSTSGGPSRSGLESDRYDLFAARPSTPNYPFSTPQQLLGPVPPPIYPSRIPSTVISHPSSSSFPAANIVSHPLPPESTTEEPNLISDDENSESEEDEDEEGPGATYSRVLVGSVCAMCQRLTDEDGEEGLFFFTPDLAVRTEGVFRLKFSISDLSRVIQIGPAAGSGSAILAQAYSEPFTVYSAKKFPGVIPTTKLTSLFAAQHVKLPTRHKRLAGEEREGEEADDG